MIKPVRCMHCGTKTKTTYRSIRSKHHRSTIILNDAPMHFCAKCADSLISLETLRAFRYLRTLPLKDGINEYSFDEIYDKVSRTLK